MMVVKTSFKCFTGLWPRSSGMIYMKVLQKAHKLYRYQLSLESGPDCTLDSGIPLEAYAMDSDGRNTHVSRDDGEENKTERGHKDNSPWRCGCIRMMGDSGIDIERPLPRCCSVAKSSQTLCIPTECGVPGFPALHYLCHPLFSLPSIFLSIRVCSNESALHIRQPKYWSFSFSISPSSEYSGLTSFRIDWFDLLVVQGTLKSLLQHNLKA